MRLNMKRNGWIMGMVFPFSGVDMRRVQLHEIRRAQTQEFGELGCFLFSTDAMINNGSAVELLALFLFSCLVRPIWFVQGGILFLCPLARPLHAFNLNPTTLPSLTPCSPSICHMRRCRDPLGSHMTGMGSTIGGPIPFSMSTPSKGPTRPQN